MTITGIDVSNYQSSSYSLTNVDFVIVKATQSTNYVNPKRAAQVQRARDNGRVVGHYHFLVAGNVQAQAAYFVAHAAPKAGDILACDWETNPADGSLPTTAEKDAFIRAVKKLCPNSRVLLYTGQNLWVGKDTSGYVGDGLWIAQYNGKPGQPSIKAPWLIHQYTSTPLDTNVAAFDSRAAMAAWAAGTSEETDMTPDQAAQLQALHDNLLSISSLTEKDAKGQPVAHGAGYYLAHIHYDALKIVANEAAQTAAITALAQLIGSGVDTAAVVTAVQQAIADAVVKVSVDVTGPSAT